MKVHRTIREGLRYRGWTHSEAIAYFIYAAANRLHIAPNFFHTIYLKESLWRENKQKTVSLEKVAELFRQKWLKQNNGESYFDFGICKLPDISDNREKMQILPDIFDDTLMFPCFFNDNYDKFIVEYMDRNMHEGPYGYTDGAFDVTVKKGDVVIDAGAWIGDFSAYAASKGATAYAFEPVSETYALLCKTQVLNNINGGGGGFFLFRKAWALPSVKWTSQLTQATVAGTPLSIPTAA